MKKYLRKIASIVSKVAGKRGGYLLMSAEMSTIGVGRIEAAAALRGVGVRVLPKERDPAHERAKESADFLADPQDSIYRGINLWSGVRYNSCVELQCFFDELDLNDPVHLEAVQKWLSIAYSYVDLIYEEFSKARPLAIVVFQGHFISEHLLRLVAIKESIPVFSVERTAHKDRLIFEPISGVTVNRNSAKSHYWRYSDALPNGVFEKYADELIRSTKAQKQSEHRSPDKAFEGAGNRRTLLFLGQVYTDSSLLFGIRGYENPCHVFNDVVSWCKDHDYFAVFKLHPKESSGVDPVSHREYRSLTRRKWEKSADLRGLIESGVMMIDSDNEFDTYSMIDQSDLVVTINSQAGLEAAIRGKSVVVNSGAFYAGLGFTFDFQTQRTLYAALSDASEASGELKKRNLSASRMFIYTFYERFCIPFSAQSLAKKILSKG